MTSIGPYRECARDKVAASETPRSSYGRVPCRSTWRGLGSRLRRSETAVAFVAVRSIIVAHAWKDVSLASPIFNHKEASLYISNLFFLPSRHFLRHYDTSVRFATARTTTASSSCVGEQLQSRCGCVLTPA